MPGGALAVKKPYRMALGYLLSAEAFGRDEAFGPAEAFGRDGSPGEVADWLDPELTRAFLDHLDPREVEVVRVQLARGLNAPTASSAGRLFDAAASLLGIRDVAEYEAQAAVELELLAEEGSLRPLPYEIVRRDDLLVYDPRPTLRALLEGCASGDSPENLAARFQETIAAVTRQLCGDVRVATGLRTVALSGGVFQNQWLATTLVRRLTNDGFEVHTNRLVPANDGGISYGQAAVAAARLAGAS
jgi:hydrogenase maturation protein HypF